MNTGPHYVVATVKSWNVAQFSRRTGALPGTWHLIERPEALTVGVLDRIKPRYVFLPHWSWRVPDEIVTAYECVCFHMTDVPYGRGGSPLQNLILRGHEGTVMSALRMVHELDAGPVYMKRPLSLEGSAQTIFERASRLVFDMIEQIVQKEPEPEQQTGAPVVFERRRPEQSEIPADLSSRQLYDFIRMLDAEGYPNAFVEVGRYRMQFTNAAQENGGVRANVSISVRGGAS